MTYYEIENYDGTINVVTEKELKKYLEKEDLIKIRENTKGKNVILTKYGIKEFKIEF